MSDGRCFVSMSRFVKTHEIVGRSGVWIKLEGTMELGSKACHIPVKNALRFPHPNMGLGVVRIQSEHFFCCRYHLRKSVQRSDISIREPVPHFGYAGPGP